MLQEHRSRPLWARELKPVKPIRYFVLDLSRPLWARELKLTYKWKRGGIIRRAPCGRVN